MPMNLFEQNTRALRYHHPQLADQVDKVSPDSTRYRLIQARNQRPSFEYITEDGTSILWHSRYDPIKEAQRELDSIDHSTIYFPLVAGIGLGYVLRLLWDQYRQEFYDAIILEKDIHILRLAMDVTRLDDIFSDPRVSLYISDDLSHWPAVIKKAIPGMMSSPLQVIAHPASQKCFQSFYQQAFDQLSRQIKLANAEFDLMIRSGKAIQENLWMNLPAITHSSGLRDVSNKLANQPVIVAAAGPSLDNNVHQLRPVQNHITIICVDTAYRTLVDNGITPDIIVSTDPTSLNQAHFEGLIPDPSSILAFDPEVFHTIPNQWPHNRLFLNLEKNAFTRWIEDCIGPFGYLPKGGSVGHTAFYLARELGADPIVFIGLDLAFNAEGGKTHSSSSALHRKYGKIESGSKTAQLGPRLDTGPMNENIAWVEGVTGEMVPTSQIMSLYINQFSDIFNQTNARIIDATEGGAFIRGSEIHRLSTVLDGLPSKPKPSFIPKISLPSKITTELINQLNSIYLTLEEGKNQAEQGLRCCEYLIKLSKETSRVETREWTNMVECFNFLYDSNHLKIAMEQAMFSAVYYFVQKERPDQLDIRIHKYKTYFETYLSHYSHFYNMIRTVAGIMEDKK